MVCFIFSRHRQSSTGSVVVTATCATSPLSQITSKTKKMTNAILEPSTGVLSTSSPSSCSNWESVSSLVFCVLLLAAWACGGHHNPTDLQGGLWRNARGGTQALRKRSEDQVSSTILWTTSLMAARYSAYWANQRADEFARKGAELLTNPTWSPRRSVTSWSNAWSRRRRRCWHSSWLAPSALLRAHRGAQKALARPRTLWRSSGRVVTWLGPVGNVVGVM